MISLNADVNDDAVNDNSFGLTGMEQVVLLLKKISSNQQKLIDLQVGANEMLKRLLMKR